MDNIDEVRKYYNETVSDEWNRIAGRPEFLLTCRFIDKYVRPGDRVLDIGGGPGRYSFYLAEKKCDTTLLDLSDGNIGFARKHADENGIALETVCGDARIADKLTNGLFDCVLLMGPLYHLLEEEDRTAAVNAALKCLKPGGVLFASFISIYGGMIYMTKIMPEIINSVTPAEMTFLENLINGESFGGEAFTRAYFIQPREVEQFMSRFPLEKLHIFGQEGIMSPNEDKIKASSPEVVSALLDFSEKTCENPELYSWSEHLMYVGRKKAAVMPTHKDTQTIKRV